MARPTLHRLALAALVALVAAVPTPALAQAAAPAPPPAPPIATMSALAFAPDGTLFVGDARQAAVFAVELGPRERRSDAELSIPDLETQVAALLGTRPEDVVIHDLAVDPLSLEPYLAVSRNRGKWRTVWDRPNDLGDASELVRIRPDGRLEGVDLAARPWSRAELPKPVAPGTKHPWKEDVDLRTEAITDLAWDDGTIWVAGLSNEEFSSAIWRVAYPFGDAAASITTVENYHVAHEKWETEAPVRTLVPLTLGGKKHLVAAYLCTPLVLFETESLKNGAHVKGRTVAELGAGNYPLDLVTVTSSKGQRLFLANSNLPLFVIDVAKLEAYRDTLASPVDSYTAGLPVEYRSGVGTQQIDLLGGKFLLSLKRAPGGTLELESVPLAR